MITTTAALPDDSRVPKPTFDPRGPTYLLFPVLPSAFVAVRLWNAWQRPALPELLFYRAANTALYATIGLSFALVLHLLPAHPRGSSRHPYKLLAAGIAAVILVLIIELYTGAFRWMLAQRLTVVPHAVRVDDTAAPLGA